MPIDPLAVLERETAAFARVLDDGDLHVPVAGCPGWTLADLGRHLGGIHRWARAAVLVGESAEPTGPADDAAVPDWYRAGAAALLDTLRAADPAARCWTFAPPADTVAFWARRQAHETTLHRWDAEHARGRDPVLDADVALDGIAEVAEVFTPRQVRLGRLAATPDVVHLLPTDVPGDRVLPVGSGDRAGSPVGSVAGAPTALLLLLWRRVDLDSPRLTVTGDRAAVRACLDRPLTP